MVFPHAQKVFIECREMNVRKLRSHSIKTTSLNVRRSAHFIPDGRGIARFREKWSIQSPAELKTLRLEN